MAYFLLALVITVNKYLMASSVTRMTGRSPRSILAMEFFFIPSASASSACVMCNRLLAFRIFIMV
jgi:hypothetical protein